jgi:hypothetical protein
MTATMGPTRNLASTDVLKPVWQTYDDDCVRTNDGPGQSYLGGATPHVTRNETVDVAITFVHRTPAENPGQAVPAPTGCALR